MNQKFSAPKWRLCFHFLIITALVSNQVAFAQPVKRSVDSVLMNGFRPPAGTALVLFSLAALTPTVLADASGGKVDGGTGRSPIVDSTVACIVAREFAEGIMFAASHVGAVVKNTNLSPLEKQSYLKSLVPAIACGVLAGGVISISVGFGVSQALGNLDTVSNGVELGEAISKTLGAFFVSHLTLKIPTWFGISNVKRDQVRPELGGEGDLERGSRVTPQQMGSHLAMSMSLFWNTLRESAEGGTLTALTALLSTRSMHALGPSVGVGIGAAAVLGAGFGLGAKYVNAKGFGVAATILAEALAIGLVTGAVRSYEQVYAFNHDGATTPLIYDVGGTETGDALTSMEAIGISDNLTVLQLAAWVGSVAVLTGLHIWHNYYGKPIVPETITSWIREVGTSIRGALRASVRAPVGGAGGAP